LLLPFLILTIDIAPICPSTLLYSYSSATSF
jgi:hypothetical protein